MKAIDLIRAAVVALALAALAACQTGGGMQGPGERRADRLQLIEANAGALIEDFGYPTRIRRFEVVGDNELVLWTEVDRAYLLYVRKPCFNLEHAFTIGVTSTANRVKAGVDRVTFKADQNLAPERCIIDRIRPVDVDALKRAERETGTY